MKPAPETLAGWQKRLLEFDENRGWEKVAPEHTALHGLEEFGEVARELLVIAAYKTPDAGAEERLAGEMADLFFILFKLANQMGVTLQSSLARKLAENESRFPVLTSRAAMAAYIEARGKDKG